MARLVAILMDRKRDDKFRSSTPKLLHPLAGRALWQWAYEAVRAAGAVEVCFVGDSAAMSELAEHSMVAANLDDAVKKLGAAQGYLLAYADAALLHPEDLLNIAAEGADAGGPRLPDMRPDTEIEETGLPWHPAFCFIPAAARKVLTGTLGPTLLPGGVKGDLSNVQVDSFESGFRVLDRVDLADAEAHLRSRIVEAHMLEGVTFVDPASCFVDAGVSLGKDTVVHPFTFLTGDTQVGANCVVGPFARLHDSRLDDGAQVEQSVLESVRVRAGAHVGPWARLRPGSDVGEQAHVGSFVELKNAKLGKSAKAGHLSYLGDAEVGEGANIGAGTITANFDGKAKHKTKVGKKAFIGSGTVLVAPVEVGDSAVTGAGSVVLKGRNVPKGVTVAGVPAKPIKTVKPKKKRSDG
jgi:bifunctional N-acetylglucosamine-1-phosphate-uridyltransferase/glucosamine-1-phosphate-acetyltransferase GlmU-like protein